MNPENVLPLVNRFAVVLADATEPMTTGQIAALAGVGERNARSILAIMRQFGTVQRHDGYLPTWTLKT
jgi:hypothetical protein